MRALLGLGDWRAAEAVELFVCRITLDDHAIERGTGRGSASDSRVPVWVRPTDAARTIHRQPTAVLGAERETRPAMAQAPAQRIACLEKR